MAGNLKSKRITISSKNVGIDKFTKSMTAKRLPEKKLVDSFRAASSYAKMIENSIERRFEKLKKFDKYKRKQNLDDAVSLNLDIFNLELSQDAELGIL